MHNISLIAVVYSGLSLVALFSRGLTEQEGSEKYELHSANASVNTIELKENSSSRIHRNLWINSSSEFILWFDRLDLKPDSNTDCKDYVEVESVGSPNSVIPMCKLQKLKFLIIPVPEGAATVKIRIEQPAHRTNYEGVVFKFREAHVHNLCNTPIVAANTRGYITTLGFNSTIRTAQNCTADIVLSEGQSIHFNITYIALCNRTSCTHWKGGDTCSLSFIDTAGHAAYAHELIPILDFSHNITISLTNFHSDSWCSPLIEYSVCDQKDGSMTVTPRDGSTTYAPTVIDISPVDEGKIQDSGGSDPNGKSPTIFPLSTATWAIIGAGTTVFLLLVSSSIACCVVRNKRSRKLKANEESKRSSVGPNTAPIYELAETYQRYGDVYAEVDIRKHYDACLQDNPLYSTS